MRLQLFTAIAALAVTACSQSAQSETPLPSPPSEAIPAEQGEMGPDWRVVAPENLLVVKTSHGETLIELNPDFAPGHTARMRQLAKDRALNSTEFYRVIDAFVAQTGLNDGPKSDDYPEIMNENERAISEATVFTPLGNDDLFAPLVGHADGFAVGRNPEAGTEWLLHCPGAVAMARNTDPNSGAADYYIVLDAQRYLDRNLTVFGRVVSGMEFVQKVRRGDPEIASGVIQEPARGDTIFSVTLASEMPVESRPVVEVMKTNSGSFEGVKRSKRNRTSDFFYNTPPSVVDICDMATPSKRVK